MEISFGTSKNGEVTCSIDNISLHSRYNPQEEANKFVNNLITDFEPSNIIITGPCLPYLVNPLKAKFPKSKIIAIQYSSDFEKYNNSWDKVFTIEKNTSILDFQEILFNFFGEEQLFSSLFLSWKPSEKPFNLEYNLAWKSIKNALDKAKILVGTRSYFNKTWLLNSIRFFKNVNKLFLSNEDNKKYFLDKTSKPFLITASGPSLKNQIDFLKSYKDSFFLLALSSSLAVLLSNDIVPDCVLTTDGGYYAKRHLRILETNPKYNNIPIIVPPEAKISNTLLETNPIIPLNYLDSIDSEIMNFLQIESLPGSRNGTVSGTAAELGLFISKKNVYFVGLDLCPSTGFSHTQPNELEKDNSLKDNKIHSTETRICPSGFANSSLEIYRNWFATRNQSFYNRVYRIVSNEDKLENIPNLQDISNSTVKEMEKLIENKGQKIETVTFNYKNTKENGKVAEFFKSEFAKIKDNQIKTQEEWFKIASYTDFIQYQKSKQNEKKLFFDILLEKTTNLFTEIFDFLSK